MCRDLYEISSQVHSDQSCLLLLSPIWARKILLSVLILVFIFPEISSIFAMSSSSFEDICSTTFSKQQRQMFKKKRLLTLNTCQWIYQQTKCLKFLKRKQTRSHNKWTLPHSDLSCCQCFCAFHYICYYIDLRVFVVIYYHINFLLV